MKQVFFTLLLLTGLVVWVAPIQHNNVVVLSPLSIHVFAGNDRTDCLGQSLLIQELQATINGDVSDGDWISFGDGRFQPGNLLTVRYSVAQAQQIRYVPGSNDISLGFYRLMLLSDAPVGNPQERKTDEVKISFQTAPPLFCSNNFTIALNESCSQKVDVTMLQSNPVPPYTNYIVELYTKDGKIIPDNILTKDHIGKEISYKLGHQCTSNVCYGSFFVKDFFPPVFKCSNDTVFCNASVVPESLGFPIPSGAWVDTIINKKYLVKNWDKCSDVTLEYTDQELKPDCSGQADRIITRKWKAKDVSDNTSECTEIIFIKRMPLDSVVFPVNFDGLQAPFFECGDTFPVLTNGNPSPDTTGIPGIGFCGHLQYQYSDIVFAECGNSFKIARNWFVIDWCTSSSRSINQLIYIKDTRAPEIVSQDTIHLVTDPYSCNTAQITVPDLILAKDCSEFTTTYKLKRLSGENYNDKIVFVNNKYYFKSLPLGVYTLEYISQDLCNNTSVDTSIVIVSDKTAPYTVCKEHTAVTLDNTGNGRVFAASFDNGSSDNCAIDNFKVRRMQAACGRNDDWADYVDFCCADIGTTQMVVFQVTDASGNRNTCMVEVNVADKLKPTITCPPDITLACSDDYDPSDMSRFGTVVTTAAEQKNIIINNFYHKGVVGKDGLAKDNCSVAVKSRTSMDIACHTGFIYRTFVATDASGNSDSCVQTITILNPDPFDGSDITWPDNYSGNGCKLLDADPEVTGYPEYKNTACSNVTHSYTDQHFYMADSACVKIFRTWSVMDWCQFDQSNPKEGIYSKIQVIKLSNNQSPEIVSSCQDTVYCSFVLDCGLTNIILSASASDDCTASDYLSWTYELDLNNDNTYDIQGNASRFEVDIPMGSHSVRWTVTDQCGNYTQCVRRFSVEDCKKPTPYCISYLTKSLDAVTGELEISAIDFDKGSSDNCTVYDDLVFTFDRAFPVHSKLDSVHYFKGDGFNANLSDYLSGQAQRWDPVKKSSTKYFDCSNIDNGISDTVSFQMTVFDKNGYSDFCEVVLIMQDNSDVCPDVVTKHSVSGSVKTENNEVVDGVEVSYHSSEKEGSAIVDKDGRYVFPDLLRGRPYTIGASLNSDPLEGVNTLDIVLIQRHILGLSTLDSPYKLIAADVDNNKYVSASDLTKIRKLILGVTDKFSKDVPSWVFVAKDGITNPNTPLIYKSLYDTDILQNNMDNVDFVAVKIGDVNNSALNEFKPNNQTENRINTESSYVINYTAVKEMNHIRWVFTASDALGLDALQAGLDFYNAGEILSFNINDNLNMEHDYVSDGKTIKLLMYHAQPESLKSGDILFEIYTDLDTEDATVLKKLDFKSEILENGKIRTIRFKKLTENNFTTQFKLQNNPVSNQLIILANKAESTDYRYEIIDADGRSYKTGMMSPISEASEFIIDLPQGMLPGIYWIKIQDATTSASLKFIYIK